MANTKFEDVHGKQGVVIQAETSVELRSTTEAKLLFVLAKERLLDVNNWQNLTGNLYANFQLTDQNAAKLYGPAMQGNLIQIDIPGPGARHGKGFDWVRVEQINQYIQENTESISIVVRPASSPLSQIDGVTHFYASQATSTFTLTKINNIVTALIYDKNLKPNMVAETNMERIRNAVVGAAAILVFSKLQWKRLTNGLLRFTDSALTTDNLKPNGEY